MPEEPKPLFTEEELYNVRAIKLSNGNDIVACILASDPDKMIVKRPCQLMHISENGTISLILTKWQTNSLGDTHVINSSSVVSYCKINENMLQFYIESVQRQITDEITPKPSKSIWPDWMDKPLTKNLIN
jgi:hypothetical protein